MSGQFGCSAWHDSLRIHRTKPLRGRDPAVTGSPASSPRPATNSCRPREPPLTSSCYAIETPLPPFSATANRARNLIEHFCNKLTARGLRLPTFEDIVHLPVPDSFTETDVQRP